MREQSNDPLRPRSRGLTAAAVSAPALVVIGGAAVAHYSGAVPVSFLTRDPSQIVEFPFYYGAVSHLGIAAWCAAAGVCFFAAALLRDRNRRRFLLGGGAMSCLLAIDDLFVVHDVVFPDHLGLHEAVAVGLYGVVLAAYLLPFATLVARDSKYRLLVASCALFVLSIASDREVVKKALGLGWAEEFFVEDGLKLLGISCWLAYFALTARGWVLNPKPGERQAVAAPPPVGAEPRAAALPARLTAR